MERDDAQVGHVLSRREALALIGAAGASVLGGGSALAAFPARPAAAFSGRPLGLPSCIVRPRQTEGPYFVDEKLERSDIRSDPTDGSVKEGSPLRLTFHISRLDASGCGPLPGALVNLWQCDALGVYSDVRDINGRFDTRGQKFLRGYQVTDPDGIARFTTIYPGWYQGRTVHIHFKIRTDPSSEGGREFTSQLYFDDSLTDRVMGRELYASKGGQRGRVRNMQDGIFRNGGDQLIVAPTEDGKGYAATFDIGLQIT